MDRTTFLIGVAIWIFGVVILCWIFKALFVGRRFLVKTDGKVKEYQLVSYKFQTGEGKAVAAFMLFGLAIFWMLTGVFIIHHS